MRAIRAVVLLTASLLLTLTVGQGAAALPSGPSSCTSNGIRSTLLSFANAFNRGDDRKLDAIFAQKPDFQWYATGTRTGSAAKRRDTLLAYFDARHSRGERLGVVSFGFNGNAAHYGNFEMTMRSSVPGVRHGDWLRLPGKGAAVCSGGATQLIVMSFGRPESPARG